MRGLGPPLRRRRGDGVAETVAGEEGYPQPVPLPEQHRRAGPAEGRGRLLRAGHRLLGQGLPSPVPPMMPTTGWLTSALPGLAPERRRRRGRVIVQVHRPHGSRFHRLPVRDTALQGVNPPGAPGARVVCLIRAWPAQLTKARPDHALREPREPLRRRHLRDGRRSRSSRQESCEGFRC